MVNDEFIGAGWAFPLRTDATGGIALVTREREIEESIRLILGTAYGERPMRPEFGCGIHDEVFSPADAATFGGSPPTSGPRCGAGSRGSTSGRSTWPPTPTTRRPSSSTSATRSGRSNDPRNLVFPFYVIPAED